MKRSKQGYVMALVLVVMLLLTSVASLVAANSVRNIESGGASFVQEQARIKAESSGMQAETHIQTLYSHLKASEDEETPIPIPDDIESTIFFETQLNGFLSSFCYSWEDLTFSTEKSTLVPTPESIQQIFTVSVSSSVDGRTVTAEIQIQVEYKGLLDPIVPDAPVDPEEEPEPRTVNVTSVEYTSYSIL